MAAAFEKRFGVRHLSSGDLLREALRRGDSLGKEAARWMKSGALVPDQLVTDLIGDHLDHLGPTADFVLDGFPRTAEQARALDRRLSSGGHVPIDRAIRFEVSMETIVNRLAGRRVCRQCGANYHVVTLPPRRSGVCDSCGGILEIRGDDQPETVRRRVEVYQDQIQPLEAYYEAQGKLRELSGESSVEKQVNGLVAL